MWRPYNEAFKQRSIISGDFICQNLNLPLFFSQWRVLKCPGVSLGNLIWGGNENQAGEWTLDAIWGAPTSSDGGEWSNLYTDVPLISERPDVSANL